MNLITDDWRLKLLAVGLAVLMLGAVAFAQNPPTTKSFTVPIVQLHSVGPGSRLDQSAIDDHCDRHGPGGPDRDD